MNVPFEAQVTAVFGRGLLVRDREGVEHRARVRGRRLSVVCGDEVLCEKDTTHSQIYVTEARPRRTALFRSNLRGEAEPVLANITRLFVVLAPRPTPDLFVVDRYLCAATSAGIAPMLVLNKRDLSIDAALQDELNAYAAVGFPTLTCSARTGEGTEALIEAAADNIAALVGQSGVGKSSLIRHLVPGAEVEVGELMRDEEGRHTTTASRMFPLANGGQLIDSPGVRDFAPAIDVLNPRDLGFPEVAHLAPQCRFQDCQHMREPQCAVRAAAESGSLHARRYESYRRLRRLYEELVKARGPKYRPPT
jgi:ribosome biogenesis GTPase